MYNSLDLFQTAGAMARNAGARQAVVARNIANADTPGYQAQTIPPFKEIYAGGVSSAMRVTRPGHIGGNGNQTEIDQRKTPIGEPSPNGNTVSIDTEMLNSAEITREHDQALAVYRHAMTVLRTSLGRS